MSTPRPLPRALPRALRRPRLLVAAARAGVAAYVRETHLAPIAPATDAARNPAAMLDTLRQIEATCEAARRDRATGYSPGRHVSVLTALIAETRRLSQVA